MGRQERTCSLGYQSSDKQKDYICLPILCRNTPERPPRLVDIRADMEAEDLDNDHVG